VSQAEEDEFAAYQRPVPAPDNVTTPYWEACSRGELIIQRCPSCGERQFYPRAMCKTCGETPEWETASGRGTVHTYTIIRQNYSKPFRELLPYVVAIVELEEGVRMMGNVLDVAPEDVRIGMPVEVTFEQAGENIGVPFWRPV
jgi:uncharacterized OB-fold protein